MNSASSTPSPFRQPRAVLAVAFTCVVSFMGIGLVDPILPALAHQLKASPSQVELLFTSYLVITAIAMLVTGWVSSRIGAKRTLVVGLALIVVFAGLAGASHTINGIVAFRAGWGLGNALFIATSLAVIVSSAAGGFAGAIVLYETALGVGIAAGPLLGGLLGNISWRGPFYGVCFLMFIGLIATITLVPRTPPPPERSSIKEPVLALRHRSLARTSLAGLLYNWGFFTILGFAPFLMGLSALKLGAVFCAWGLLVAIFAVTGASVAKRRFGTSPTLIVSLSIMTGLLAIIAVFPHHRWVVIGAVIASGAVAGLNNTLLTTAVMGVSPVPRNVAAASYGFVRFIGGGFAPYAAGRLAEHYNVHVPFALAAVAVIGAAAVIASVTPALRAVDEAESVPGHTPIRESEEAAVTLIPAEPEEAIIATQALRDEDRIPQRL